MTKEEYNMGFDDGEGFAIANVESYLPNISTDKLWSLFSAVQVELEGRDGEAIASLFDAPSSGDLHEEALQYEADRVAALVFPACGSFD